MSSKQQSSKKNNKNNLIPLNILEKQGINVFIKSQRNHEHIFNRRQKKQNENVSLAEKIIIFDINPLNDQTISELVAGKLSLVIRNISEKNILVFSSIMSFESMHELLVKDLKLTKGFIISNNGARIYDVFNKQFIFQKALTDDQKNMIAHNGCMFAFYTIASTQNQDLAYYCNYLDAEDFTKLSYHEFSYTTNYTIYSSYFTSNSFLSFMCFEKDEQVLKTKYQYLMQVAKEWDLEVSNINNRMFTITNSGVNKLNAIYLIIGYLNFEKIEEIYYFSLNGFDIKCWNAFSKNHYINIDYLIHTNIKARIDESFYLSSLNIALVRLLKAKSKYRNFLMCKNFFTSLSNEGTIDSDEVKKTSKLNNRS